MRTKTMFALAALGLTMGLVGCGSQDATANDPGRPAMTASSQAAPAGNVVEVKMVTDGAGNYFEPADFTVRRGDVVRFVLVSGVHNVSFPAADNPGASSLPQPSTYLQLPGQTFDVAMDLPAGDYVYQCDPHAALGMVGTITVE